MVCPTPPLGLAPQANGPAAPSEPPEKGGQQVTTARPQLGAGQEIVDDLREAQADVYGDLLSTAQVCEVLGISRWTIRRLVQDEKLTTVKLRGRVYVRESVLRGYIAAQHDEARAASARGTAPQPRARKTTTA